MNEDMFKKVCESALDCRQEINESSGEYQKSYYSAFGVWALARKDYHIPTFLFPFSKKCRRVICMLHLKKQNPRSTKGIIQEVDEEMRKRLGYQWDLLRSLKEVEIKKITWRDPFTFGSYLETIIFPEKYVCVVIKGELNQDPELTSLSGSFTLPEATAHHTLNTVIAGLIVLSCLFPFLILLRALA